MARNKGAVLLFGRKSFLDPEDEAWHLDMWKFLLTHFGGIERLKHVPIVNATRKFFPPSEATGEARAEHIFGCVKGLAGMSEWPCKLLAQPERPQAHLGRLALLQPVKDQLPLGTFSARGGEVTITYDPASVREPAELVATFIHELAHYLLATVRSEVPGGEDMHEYATDLMTVFLGFAAFGANRAFNFSQHGDAFTQGWKWSRQGYLRERDWVFAIAVFLGLRGEKPETFKELLKPNLYSDMKAAARYLAKKPALLEQHRAIKAVSV
jgi:hypothetical protein